MSKRTHNYTDKKKPQVQEALRLMDFERVQRSVTETSAFFFLPEDCRQSPINNKKFANQETSLIRVQAESK